MNDLDWTPAPLIERLRQAQRIAVMTGAGISAESGIPTFRDDADGLWSKFRPEQLATPGAFSEDPATTWDWYRWRRQKVAAAHPNAGHAALAALQTEVTLDLITQNVDGLHLRAGSTDVVEFHGNLFEDRCDACGYSGTGAVAAEAGFVPHCPRCNAVLRPGVVLFGEMIPEDGLSAATAASESCDLFLSIGTSSQVYPAASFAEFAKARGATLVEVNPEYTPLTPLADYALTGPAAEVLPALLAALAPHR